MRKVFITGLGTISAIGNNVAESYQSLLAKRSGIGAMQLLQSNLKNTLPVGEVRLSNSQLLQLLGLQDKSRIYSRTSLLAMIAAKEAFEHAKLGSQRKQRMGMFSGTSVGGMDKGEAFYQDYLTGDYQQKLGYARVHDCGESTECVADFLGINDFITTVSTACSSAANAIMQATKMIQKGLLDGAVAGGADAFSLFTLNGFNSLKILSDEFCKPFDQNRKGLNLGEGAGFLVLESEESVEKYYKTPLAEITGYGNACDAFHQTASSADGQGAWLAMSAAIAQSGVKAEAIGYINMHGTATPNNDLSEGTAVKRIFSGGVPAFSSTKAYTGHTLAASGGIESVFATLALQNNIAFPNLNFEMPIEELGMMPATEIISIPDLKHILSNSFGFGGNNTSLLFSKC